MKNLEGRSSRDVTEGFASSVTRCRIILMMANTSGKQMNFGTRMLLEKLTRLIRLHS